MPSERWFDERAIAFRAHCEVRGRRWDADSVAVLTVELADGHVLSVLDPYERFPAELVGTSRTLAFAIAGFPDVRSADHERQAIEAVGEGRVDLVGRRTARSTWDGSTLGVPLDVGPDRVHVPICETTRPSTEANADLELLDDAGILDCDYVAVDGARLYLYAVDSDVDTDPWAGVVYDDVTFEVDHDDDRFRRTIIERNGLDADAVMRVALGPRWFLGDADGGGQDDVIGGHLGALMDTLVDVLEGESSTHPFLYASLEYRFEPIDRDVVRVTITDGKRCINPRFPPDGALVNAESFAMAVLRAARDLLRRVEQLNPDALDRFEHVRTSAGALELELRFRGAM